MLHTETVTPRLLELLEAIMRDSTFGGFALAGGTALALQIGHRQSVDIDLFGPTAIDELAVLSAYAAFGPAIKLKRSPNILICTVDGIKVDLVNFQYPALQPILQADGLRLLSPADIGAMKLNAIAGRGSRKDFIDLYFLLRTFSFNDLMGFYRKKYPDGSCFMVMKSLTYFDDADLDVHPRMFEHIEWSDIKSHIRACV